MAGRDQAADTAFGIIAGHEGGYQVTARNAQILGHRQHCRANLRRRMPAHGAGDIVIVQGMRGAAVDQTGLRQGALSAGAYQRGARRATLLRRLGSQDRRQRLRRTGQGDGEPID